MKRKIFFSICIAILLIISLYFLFIQSSNNSYNQNDEISKQNPNWTVIIYMSGDNWLDEMIPRNLGHIKSVGSSDDVNIITLVDRKGTNNSNLYYIETYDVNETPLNTLNPLNNDELNLGDPDTLSDFVCWAIDNYPAQNYLLIIWGHGEGWKGVAKDSSDYLTMPELDIALKKIIENKGGEKLDIIGFDACNMGMLEVFYQIKDYADIAIASEKEIPERGWPYYQILMSLKQNPNMSPEKLSELIVNHYCNAYSSGELEADDFSVALSAVELNKIDNIIDNLEFIKTEEGKLITYENPEYIDLYQYAQENTLLDLMTVINDSVIAEKHWSNPNGKEIECAYGMIIYYPKDYDSNYDHLKFTEDANWDESLKDAL